MTEPDAADRPPAAPPPTTAGRPLRHDPARRDPGREHHPVARGQARIRRMLDEYGMPYIRPAGPARTPRTSIASPPPATAWRRPGWRRSARPAIACRTGPTTTRPPRARRGRDAGRHDLRQELAGSSTSSEVLGEPGGEPRHGRGLGGRRGHRGREADATTRSITSTASGPSRLRPRHPPGRSRGGRTDPRAVRHQWRDDDRRAARIVDATTMAVDADPGAPAVAWGIHTTTTPSLAVANSMAAVAAGVRHVQADDQRLRRELRQRQHGGRVLANLALDVERP